MNLQILPDKQALGRASGEHAAQVLRRVLDENEQAHLILATGASQFGTLQHLTQAPGIPWERVVMFHLDEYIGMDAQHPASFRKYLRERFVEQVPALKAVHFLQGDADDPLAECQRVGRILQQHPIDLALVGIGENGHLAFNDPPADFDTHEPYIIVELDEACRQQQYGEGWFDSMDSVPRRAMSMSVHQIMKSKEIICSVPDARKARAVKSALEGPVTNMVAASMLQRHPHCSVFLDEPAAALLASQA